MTRRNRAKASSLFLIELILAILFFSIVSAVCVQFFVKSHLLSRKAQELNAAVREVSNAAELITASDGTASSIRAISSQYPNSSSTGDSQITVYYSDALMPCREKDAKYSLNAAFSKKGTMLLTKLDMNRTKDKSCIYSLDISHHLKGRDNDGT